MSVDHQYNNLVQDILSSGERHENRTGVDTRRLWGHLARFDLSESFPLLTTKRMAIKAAFVELLGFVRGITDVTWYQERGCKIWNADHERWHGKDRERDREAVNRFADMIGQGKRVTGQDAEDVARIIASSNHRANNPDSLGRIYGAQWRDFSGYDQLGEIVKALKAGSNSRRLIMSAWNPAEFHMMCLPPCHVAYHFVKRGDYVDIAMWQRSCDVALGVPFNWATTALLCHLVANAAGLKAGKMVWYGDDVHIYEPHIEQLTDQICREPKPGCQLVIAESAIGKSPWDIEYEDIAIQDYTHHDAIRFELFVG